MLLLLFLLNEREMHQSGTRLNYTKSIMTNSLTKVRQAQAWQQYVFYIVISYEDKQRMALHEQPG